MSDYNADDIYVLYNMINKPVLKTNVNKLITKYVFFLYLDNREINIYNSISRLLKAGFIRENTPSEFLKYLTISDIKQLLNRKGNLTKDLLVLEAESIVSDEEIMKHPKYMTFYMITSLGNETLTKYKNLILFFDKSRDIFGYGKINGRFNTSYFFKNYTHDSLEEILNYYDDKDPEIAGKVCYIKEDYDTAISYAVQSISKIIAIKIDEVVNRSSFFDTFDLRERRLFDSWIVGTFSHIELTEDTSSDLIKQEYNQNFKYTDLLSYDLFERIQVAVMINESEELFKVSAEVSKLISDKYFSQHKELDSEDLIHEKHKKNDSKDGSRLIEDYYKKTAQDLALLDLLIGHLDLELLYGLRDRVDFMITEWEETLDIDEQTFFEEK